MDLIDDYSRKATIIRIIDGDTFTCTLDLGLRIYKTVTVRIFGINCPEIKGKTKNEGLLSKQYVENWFSQNTNFMIRTVNNGKEDSFGRLIAQVAPIDGGKGLAELLMDAGLATPYS